MTAKKKPVISLADMPEGTVSMIGSGNRASPFPQFKGLLQLAHQHGLDSLHSDLVAFSDGQAVVKAVATGSRGLFEAHGDASPDNVPRGAHHEVIRRAETRALSRSLRWYLGIGDCAADELSEQARDDMRNGREDRPESRSEPRQAQHPPQQANGQQGPPGRPQCPACGGDVWDNRAPAQGKSPLWRCKNGAACSGGRGDFGWASWDADHFDKGARAAAIDSLDERAPEQPPPPEPVVVADGEDPIPF